MADPGYDLEHLIDKSDRTTFATIEVQLGQAVNRVAWDYFTTAIIGLRR